MFTSRTAHSHQSSRTHFKHVLHSLATYVTRGYRLITTASADTKQYQSRVIGKTRIFNKQ